MALKPRQDKRIGALQTPLGEDVLVLLRFDGDEGLGELFEYRVEALSENAHIDFTPAIGGKCCISIKTEDGSKRYFNGYLVETQWLGPHDIVYHRYRLVLRPWFWMLSHTSDCRMFLDRTIPEIIKEVLGKHGIAKFYAKLTGSYPQLEYCVQYRESDFNFVSRLMEEAGIYYFFEHAEDEHTLVMVDAPSCHTAKQCGAKLKYNQTPQSVARHEETLLTWFPDRQFKSGKFTLKDFNFKKPTDPLLSEKEGGGSYQNDKLEIFDYPGRYYQKDLGDNYAKVRLEAEQAADHRCHASGHSVTCCPGKLIELAEHPDAKQNAEYLIVRASHSYVSDVYLASSSQTSEQIYSGQYEFLPKDINFRIVPHTPKPFVHGPQTAIVTGDGEIDVDEYGRIFVTFHWDREKQQSCRVRVAQIWSGRQWGGIVIPRVGMEVIVEFLEGDPDRPLVTGTVYNEDNQVPYGLPEEKTISGVKSNSSEGGDGYNELVFDDAAGNELIRIHAENDLEAKIEHNETRNIGDTLTIEAGEKIELKVGLSTIVMDKVSITIKSPTITIKADGKLDASAPLTQVTGSATLTLKGGMVLIN